MSKNATRVVDVLDFLSQPLLAEGFHLLKKNMMYERSQDEKLKNTEREIAEHEFFDLKNN